MRPVRGLSIRVTKPFLEAYILLKMASCKVCLKSIKNSQFKIQCEESECSSEFHGKCVKVTQEDMNFLHEEGKVYRCDPCNKIRRNSMRLEYGSAEGGVSLESIMSMLKEMQEEQVKNVADFNKSNNSLHEKIEENTQTLKRGMDAIENYVKEIEELKRENSTLKCKVDDLEARVEDLESYSRRNCLEIQGIPEEDDENVVEIIKNVGKALKMTIQDQMIDACHRIGRRNDKERPRGIIVKFVRRMDKEQLMNQRKEKKRDFTTRHLNLPMDLPIYLNDSLSPTKRKLLARTRQIRREKGYKYLWLRNGHILLRKEEGTSVVEVRTQADLSEL